MFHLKLDGSSQLHALNSRHEVSLIYRANRVLR